MFDSYHPKTPKQTRDKIAWFKRNQAAMEAYAKGVPFTAFEFRNMDTGEWQPWVNGVHFWEGGVEVRLADVSATPVSGDDAYGSHAQVKLQVDWFIRNLPVMEAYGNMEIEAEEIEWRDRCHPDWQIATQAPEFEESTEYRIASHAKKERV